MSEIFGKCTIWEITERVANATKLTKTTYSVQYNRIKKKINQKIIIMNEFPLQDMVMKKIEKKD